MRVEFEEKTYESYFNNELNDRASIYFAPGQVQEGSMGMDSIAFSKDRNLWKKLGYPFWFSPYFNGLGFKEMAQEMEIFLGTTIKNIPAMKANLLFQYKRPEYLKNHHCKEWHLWNIPYFRYHIYPKQQRLLEHLDTFLGAEALVLYASPAIVQVDELIKLKKKKKIIDSTNFTKASRLSGHHINTYIKSGRYSQACSNPEEIHSFNLLEFLEERHPANNISNKAFIVNFTNKVISIVHENSEYRNAYSLLVEEFQELKQYPLLFGFIQMKLVREITGIQWAISY